MEMQATLDSSGPGWPKPSSNDPTQCAAGLLPFGLVHDFNNLLTVINGYNEMLLNSCELPEKARQCLTVVRGAGERAASLARTLLDLSRRAAPALRPIDINASVTELVALAQHLLPANIQLETDLSPELRLVLADPCSILQVLLNLVVNSRDAMPEGGSVEIRTANFPTDLPSSTPQPYLPRGNYILLSITDNGIGMDDATRNRIFEPFYTTKSPGTGTGLGLPMVQHIVKQNGGFLSVQSVKGQGTTVTIYLPATEIRKAEQNVHAMGVSAVSVGGHETILVVESDPVMRKLMRDILDGLGYSVVEAASAVGAVELARSLDALDLMICEEVLPDSSGRDAVGALREVRPELPVIYISGCASMAARDDTSHPGEQLLGKPFSSSEFSESVRSMLDRKKRKRVLFVDDEEQVVMFASEVLRDAGYDVLVGEDGNVALSIVEKEPVDLVITDLVMREREGLETMMRLRKSHPQLPVVAISGAFGGHFLRSASLLGARATLAKPFSGEDLLNVVRLVLGS